MKKLVLIFSFLMLCGLSYANDIIKLKATSYAYRTTDDYGNWYDWSAWQDCNILVVIKNDRVTIYSNQMQEYDIYDAGEEEGDGEGGSMITFKCVDADALRCEIRMRRQANDQVQLYVDYNNMMFVYNVESK